MKYISLLIIILFLCSSNEHGHSHGDSHHDDNEHTASDKHQEKLNLIYSYLVQIPGFKSIYDTTETFLLNFQQFETINKILFAVGFISIVPIALLSSFPYTIKKDSLLIKIMFGFAAGCLLGEAFLHLVPHTYLNHPGKDAKIGIYIMIGILSFYLLEKMLNFIKPCPHQTICPKKATNFNSNAVSSEEQVNINHEVHFSSAILNMITDLVHNFMDGAAIASTFLIDPKIGITTTLSIFFHEIPHEISDYAILVKSGISPFKAILFQLVTAMGALSGAIFTFYLGSKSNPTEGYIFPSLAAGGFIYMACVNIIPTILSSQNSFFDSLIESMSILLGIYILSLIE